VISGAPAPPAPGLFCATFRRLGGFLSAADAPVLLYARACRVADTPRAKEAPMEEITLTPLMIQSIVALIAGILILIVPRILNYVVALYLILIGLLGLFPNLLA
jgi:hypothetical protein